MTYYILTNSSESSSNSDPKSKFENGISNGNNKRVNTYSHTQGKRGITVITILILILNNNNNNGHRKIKFLLLFCFFLPLPLPLPLNSNLLSQPQFGVLKEHLGLKKRLIIGLPFFEKCGTFQVLLKRFNHRR